MPSKGKGANKMPSKRTDATLDDERFAHIKKDPRFQQMPMLERKVKIDKRFQGMFKDKRFKEKYTVDKRGRPVNLTTTEDLKKFYELSDSEEENEGRNKKERKVKKKQKKKQNNLAESVHETEDKDVGQQTKAVLKGTKVTNKDKTQVKGKGQIIKTKTDESARVEKKRSKKERESLEEDDESDEDNDDSDDADDYQNNETSGEEDDSDVSVSAGDNSDSEIDLARGEGNMSTSSDSDDEEFDFVNDGQVEHKWGELDADAKMTEEISSRLAVCNMDWDRIKAADLLVLFSSFKPTGGIITSVKIYLSEFGKERLKEEDVKGPKELVENEGNTSKSLEGEKYHTERLRQYQMKRLKYYYAVIECDSKNTANAIYEECDGFEYQNSSTRLDLRFIPEEMTFDDEPTSEATNLPEVSTYKPSEFMTTALQQTKVDLTWDETDKERLAVTMKKFNNDELMQLDLQAYLASSSGEENDSEDLGPGDLEIGSASDDDEMNDDQRIAKYRALLIGGDEKKEEKKFDKDMELEISWEPGLKETTEVLIKTKEEEKDLTQWQQYQKKKKEKKKEKQKEERMKREEIKKKRGEEQAPMSDDDLPSDIDLNDPYFKEEQTAEHVPGKSKDKKKKKRKRGHGDDNLTAEELVEKKQKEAELELLMMDDDDDGKEHFSLKAIMDAEKDEKKKKKKKKRKQDEEETFKDTFEINVEDSRFSAIYDSHHYQIDPSDPQFKKTKAMDKIFKEKQKRRIQKETSEKKERKDKAKSQGQTPTKDDQPRKDPSLSMLVKSVKQKTGQFHSKKQKP
ncbi:ESF1 homolog [Glandiceps talaboti]